MAHIAWLPSPPEQGGALRRVNTDVNGYGNYPERAGGSGRSGDESLKHNSVA